LLKPVVPKLNAKYGKVNRILTHDPSSKDLKQQYFRYTVLDALIRT